MNSNTAKPSVLFKKLPVAGDLPLPAYESEHAAGMDICAALEEPVLLQPGERQLVPTGLQMALPAGYEVQLRPRSGLAYKHGITLLNAPGTIDADYRGEIKVLLINHSNHAYRIEHGDRIAQMIVSQVSRLEPELREELPDTVRGEGGFGSTGR